MSAARFSAKGGELFEAWFQAFASQLVADCRAEMGESLVALGLSGSYGRGEGAVVKGEAGEKVYGDIDLFAVLRGAGGEAALDAIRKRYSEDLGLAIDFNFVFREWDLGRLRPELAIFNLANGHRILWGDEDLVYKTFPLEVFSAPMPEEAARLMLCRGATLLKALRAADGFEAMPDKDLSRRCFHRTSLGIGDALLIVSGLFPPRPEERIAAFKQLEAREGAVKALKHLGAYEKAVQFKRDPDSLPALQPSRAQLEDQVFAWGRAFLLIEKKRFGTDWKNLCPYVSFDALREPEKHRLRDRVSYLFSPLPGFSSSVRHPREYLYPELVALLGLSGKQAKGAEWNQRVERFLALHKEVR